MADNAWISAFEALQRLEYKLGGSVSTKLELADRLRDGRMKAHADLIWTSDNERAVYFAWRDDPFTCSTKDVEYSTVIKPSVWRHSDLWSSDQEDWRWTTGRFALTHSIDPVTRVMLVGVKFDRTEIIRLQKSSFRPPEDRGPGGRPWKEQAWAALTHAVVEIERAWRLTKSAFPTLKEFKEELLSAIDEDLADSTSKHQISQIYKKFVEKRP